MKKVYILIAVLFTFACSAGVDTARQSQFREQLASYVGKKEDVLVEERGIPAKTYNVGAVKYVNYGWNNSYTTPVMHNSYRFPYTNQVNTYSTGGHNVTSYCEITFKIEEGYVTGWKYEGDDCF